ncbi:MAG: hypothetical protein K0U45_05835 [Alphaproteobacteria bacterium]|nr:hypothetical protein [Alphaproteobacteria bacterium]
MMKKLFDKNILQANVIIVLLMAMVVSGCSLNNSRSSLDKELEEFEQQKVSLDLVNDIPIPDGAKLDIADSLILGRGDRWTGRISMNTAISPVRAFAVFQSQMPSYGWQTVLSVQDRTSSIVFIRGDRIATLSIQPLGLRGSRIIMVASLRPADVPVGASFNGAPSAASTNGSGFNNPVPLQ